MDFSLEHFVRVVLEKLAVYLPKVAGALIVLLGGLFVISRVVNLTRSVLEKRQVEASLIPFVSMLLKILLTALLLISVAGMIGIATSSFVAVLGAAGLAVGLALQGSLSNFAGGVILLLLKPLRVGEFIEAQGTMGSVKEIALLNTTLTTPDNKEVIVPNGPLASGTITNFSRNSQRRMDLNFGVSYSDDLEQVKSVIQEVVRSEEKVLKEPAEPLIAVSELADSSVNFIVRIWVNASDYSSVQYALLEDMKKRFDREGISMPFPQRDVHLFKEKGT